MATGALGRKRISFDAVLEREVLAATLEARGPDSVQDVMVLIEEADRAMTWLGQELAMGRLSLRDYLQNGRAILRSQWEFRNRVELLERLWESPASVFEEPQDKQILPELDQRLMQKFFDVAGKEAGVSLRRLYEESTSALRKRVEEIRQRYDQARRSYARDGVAFKPGELLKLLPTVPDSMVNGMPCVGQEAFVLLAREILRQRRELTTALTTNERLKERIQQDQADRVSQLVEGFGGAKLLGDCVAQAISKSKPSPSASRSPELQRMLDRLNLERDDIVVKLRRLGVPPATVRPGTMTQSLANKVTEIQERIAALTVDASGLERSQGEQTLLRAMQGEESARGEIERLARSNPKVFPPGFADALESAMFEHSEFAYLMIDAILIPSA